MKRSKAVVVGGAVLTLLGMLLSYVYTQSARQEARAVEQSTSNDSATAWVAAGDLTIGSTWEELGPGVSKQQVPANLVPSDAIENPEDIAGKRLVRNVTKGEVLTATQFNNNGVESLDIPEGTSALTLSLPYPQGVGDYIQPGAKANFFVTVKGQVAEGTLTQLLLSDIPVLANRRALPAQDVAEGRVPDDGELLLTFAVTLEQAEKIVFAKENGSIWLTLMRPGAPADQGIGQTYGTFLL